MKCYYAHCMALYNTPQEARDIALLESLGFEVLNPNAPEHEHNWETLGMDYAHALVTQCEVFAFRALPESGNIPSGVYTEIRIAQSLDIPVIELPSCIGYREMSYPMTVEYLKEVGQR